MSSGQKGVMLCERPGPSQMDTGPGPKPFLPSSSPSGLEPLGLVPTQKTYPPSLAPKPPNINLKTIAHVKELEEENRLAALAEEERRMAEAARANNVTAFGSQLRAAILSGDDVSFWRAAKQAEGARQSLEASKARAVALKSSGASGGAAAADAATASKASMMSFVDDLVMEATVALESPSRADGTKDASTSGAAAGSGAVPTAPTPRSISGASGGRKGRGGGGGGAASNKPAWALTAEEVAKLEDAEEEELLKFADDLDFDSFMAALDDPELQECVKASSGEDGKGPAPGEEKAWRKNLVKAMNHVAMKRVAAAARRPAERDDDDAASMAMGSDGALSRATAASRLKSEAAAAKRSALSESRAGGGSDGAGGWDASTRAAEDVGRMERTKQATHEAFEFLRENPELRAVHSPASVRAMITKTDAVAGGASGSGVSKAAS